MTHDCGKQSWFRVTTLIAIVTATGAFSAPSARAQQQAPPARRSEGLAAWDSIYTVLTSPRCINCHTATSYPQQGDERRRHFANVVRGPAGEGVAGLNCASCHQLQNADATGVPGGPAWHLAPLSMRWQDASNRKLSSHAVCRALIDRSKNHGLTASGLLKHHEVEPLVLWAWSPGRRPDGTARSLPPITHQQFVNATRTWVLAGTPCRSATKSQ